LTRNAAKWALISLRRSSAKAQRHGRTVKSNRATRWIAGIVTLRYLHDELGGLHGGERVGARRSSNFQPACDIVERLHPRKQCIGLKRQPALRF
jgi:hypothetical protein